MAPKSSAKAESKFLRRSHSTKQEIFEQSLEKDSLLEDALPSLKKDASEQEETDSIVKAILRKIDIIRDKQKRLKLIKTIAKLKSSWVQAVLLETLSDPCEEIRDFVIKDLAQRKELPAECLYQKLFKTPWYIKSSVLRILGLRKIPESIKPIKLMINDPNIEVRRSLAQTLGEIGGKESKILLLRLRKDPSPYVKVAAEEALRKVIDLKFT